MWMIYSWFLLISSRVITGLTICGYRYQDEPVKQVIYTCNNIEFNNIALVPEGINYIYNDYEKVLEIVNTSIPVLKYFSKTFSEFANFKVVNISYASIEEIQSEAFNDMKKIETLYLSNNNLPEVEPTMLESLKMIKTLSLSSNVISEIAENSFSKAVHLRTLNLSSNSLNALKPFSTYGLGNIQTLDLSHNDLSVIDLNDISNSLKVLWLNHNGIKRIIARRNDTTSSYLTNLNLSSNNIEILQKDSFNNLDQLSHLDLTSNNLRSLPKELFSDLTRIRYLNLSHNAIKQLPSGIFDSLYYLNVLDMSHNDLLVFKIDDYQYSLYNLNELYIQNNSISRVDFGNHMNYSSNLKNVSLDGNKFVCSYLLEIVKYLAEFNVTVTKGAYVDRMNIEGNICYEDDPIFLKYYSSSILITVSTILVSVIVLLIMTWIVKYLKKIKARRAIRDQIELLEV